MRTTYKYLAAALFTMFVIGCRKQDAMQMPSAATSTYNSTVATDWMRTFQKLVQTEALNPPAASRVYAYAAVSLYEAVVPGMEAYVSLQGQVAGLSNLPDAKTFGSVDYVAAANESLYVLAKNLFANAKPESLQAIEDLHTKHYNEAFRRVLSETVFNSVAFGKSVSTVVLNRANDDNYASTRSLVYTVPSSALNPSYWSPTGPVTMPLEPFWGQLKCFAMANGSACTVKSTIGFSTTPGSAFYNQAAEVISVSQNLTNEQRAIANWWSDDAGKTATPPGHWVGVVEQIARRNKLDLGKTAEVYAMLNMAMADAFISCWDEKYKMNLLRPVTYVNKYVPGGNNWTPLLATPPFPEYPSGHSVASAAAGDILTKLLGNVTFVDSSNTFLGYAPRTFNSFTEAANEAAVSRLYGGIHFREAVDNGLLQGKEVSKAVFQKIKLKK
jgi:hypothetical protein